MGVQGQQQRWLSLSALLVCAFLCPQGYAIRDVVHQANQVQELKAADKLPFTSGSIISLKSQEFDAFCNAGGRDDDPPYSVRCNEAKSSATAEGFLIIGKSFTTADIRDGSSVYLKSQKAGKFCSVGPANEGSYITCKEMHYGKDAEFLVYAAGPDGAIRMHPADDRRAWCHAERDGHELDNAVHAVRCSRRAAPESEVFLVVSSGGGGGGSGGGDYPSGGGDYPSGGGDYPSGGGDYPSGGGDYPSSGDDFPSGEGDYPSGAPSDDGSDPSGGRGYPSGSA